jgi:transcriptional regulator with XRE-family HTH domain
MPGLPIHLRALKPELFRDHGDSLGARLRRRRRELGLQIKEVAARLGTDPKTLMWWERDERLPFVRAYPAIVDLLGYEPWAEPTSLAEALLAERRRRGLSVERAAEAMGVDPGTWLRWERGEWKPTSLTLSALDQFLGMSARACFPADVR